MKINDHLIPLRENVEECIILSTPKPPKLWTVEYESGNIRKWSKSHLKKYYTVCEKDTKNKDHLH
jgi:hypothetical protein